MWGYSFDDLAKKAAEMQEQAASSIATPTVFSPSSLFNLDGLQNDADTQNQKKTQQPTPQPASAEGYATGPPPTSSSTSSSSTYPAANGGSYNQFGSSFGLGGTGSGMEAGNINMTTPPSKRFVPAPKSVVKLQGGASPTTASSSSSTTLRFPPSASNGSSNNKLGMARGKLAVPGMPGTPSAPRQGPSSSSTPIATPRFGTAALVTAPATTKTSSTLMAPIDGVAIAATTDEDATTAPQLPGATFPPTDGLMGRGGPPPSIDNGSLDGMKSGRTNNDDDVDDQQDGTVPPTHSISNVIGQEVLPTVSTQPSSPSKVTDASSMPRDPNNAEMGGGGTATDEAALFLPNLPSSSGATADSDAVPSAVHPPNAAAAATSGLAADHMNGGSEPIDSPQAEGWDMEDDDDDFDDEHETEMGPSNAMTSPHDDAMDGPKQVVMDHDDDDGDRGVASATQQQSSSPPGISRDSVVPSVQGDQTTNGSQSHFTEVATPATLPGPSEDVLRQFSDQLTRLEENHQAEMAAKQAEFDHAVATMQKEIQERDHLLQRQQMEYNREQNDHAKQLEALQKDLSKTRELLADKEREGRRLQEVHLKQLRDMEKQMNRKEDTSHGLAKTIQDLENSLEESKKELQVSRDEYTALKERAKSVASELKDRRIECRTLSSEVEILKSKNDDLQDRITQLEAVGMDMNQSSQEIQEELNTLRANLKEKEKQTNEAMAAIEMERKKGEDALASYKKKAQQSLALANSRSASAVQSKEEAEMEARAARATADMAMQRAMTAESNGKQALAEAKQYVDEMEKEVAKYNVVKASLEKATKELGEVLSEKQRYQDSNEQLKCELTSTAGRLEAEQVTNQTLKQSLAEAQNRSNELYDEVERLRRDGKRLQDEIRRLSETRKEESASEPKVHVVPEFNAVAEATIAMLKQELRDANHAIKDLKETLKATMEEKETATPHSNGGMNGNLDGGMPLFYAMEKQAELTQARDEIARLANLLGDAESSKQEALDSMQEMRLMMEDAQARLRRQEQIKKSPEQERVNLEYLKNIMLSYLNAKTVNEKKALLPVIGTVLCLTQEEQRQAIEGLDNGKTSVLDSVASGVFNLKWS